MAISILITVDGTQYNVTNDVLKDSLKLSYSLFKELEPTTNKADFSLSRSSTVLPLILATANDVVVEIKENSTYLFKGYLTDNYSWQITSRGQRPASISAEDPGIKLLQRNWVSPNALYTLFVNLKVCDKADPTNSIIHRIANLAGVTVSPNIPTISNLLSLNIQDADNPTYWDVLKQITFEYGCVFYFENDGELNLYPIAKTVITPVTTFSSTTNIIVESEKNGIDVKKKLVPYKQINLTWDEWETKSDIYVFRDSTGGDNNYDCNIPLAAGAYYPNGADADTFVFLDYAAENGQNIINVNTAILDCVVDGGITVVFENLGTRGKIRLHNTSAVQASIRKLKVKATSVLLKKNTNVNKAGTNAAPIYKYTAKYIHELSVANAFVNTIKDYYNFSNFSYTFKSKLNVDCGIVATLHDTMWSTINEPVLITNKEVKENGVITYTAVGLDVFDVFAVTPRDITIPGDANSGTVYNPQILTPTITIGTTTVDLGGSISELGGVTVTGVVTGSVTGNADTATKLFTPRSIGISGKVAGTGVSFDGSANITINTTSAAINSSEVTDATSANTASVIVKRDGSGNFSAGTITASLTGNASTATKLLNARTIGISGKVAGTATAFDGSANITINTTSASITSAEITDATAANTANMVVKRDGNGDFAARAISLNSQKLNEYTIPGSTNKILQLKNTATGQTEGDVFTILELRSPDTASTESTLSQHNVVSGTDDWVRDVSFHNYASTMKAVDVISHFTGTSAGKWEWVSRYTNGTNYNMIDRSLLTLEGDTGNLKLGEDSTITSSSRGKLDIRNSGYGSLPSLFISSDSSSGAATIQNGYNYAMPGNLVSVKMLNGSDSGTLLKLENAGTGDYLKADSVFRLAKSGSITQTGANGLSNAAFVSGSLGTGWKLDYNSSVSGKSYLEIDNLLVRDTIRTHIFQKDVIKATNGQLYVSDSGVIAKTYDGTEPYVVHLDIDKSATFNVNDEIVVKDINLSSGTVTATTRFKISSVGTAANGIQPYTVTVLEGTLWNLQTGMTAVRTSGGSVLIDASTTYRPFIDVLASGTTKARLGNLAGISGCSGYGLYSDNVYLTGKIVATSGSFTGSITSNSATITGGSLTIGTKFSVTNDGTLTASGATISGTITSNAATITGGSLTVGSKFSVTNDGTLTASGATISGAITATTGTIGSFNIGNYLNSNSKVLYNDGAAGVHVGSDGIGVGSTFMVSNSGALSATNANISGTINATSGSFSGTINADDGFFGGSIESGPLVLNKNPPSTASFTISGSIITFIQNLQSNGLYSGTFACSGTYNGTALGSTSFNLTSTSQNYTFTRSDWTPDYLNPEGGYIKYTTTYSRTSTTYSGSISLYNQTGGTLYSGSDTYTPASNWVEGNTTSQHVSSGHSSDPYPQDVAASGGTVNFTYTGTMSFSASAYTFKLLNLPAGYSSSYATGTVYYDSNGFLKIKL